MSDEAVSITKSEAIEAYGGDASALARALGISPQAVYQWKDDEPIPDKRAMQLRFVIRHPRFAPTTAASAEAMAAT